MIRRFLFSAPWAAALRHRAFRWLLLGRLASSATMQMRSVAQGWLVYSVTGSSLAFTWVGAARSLATLVFSLYGGLLSDRLEKRKVMLWCRLALVVNNLALATLVLMGQIEVWHVAASALVDGMVFAFMMPAQRSITAELVARKTLLNAMSMASLGQGVMSVISSAGAGLMIERFGAAGVFYTMAGLFAFVAFTLTRLPQGETQAAQGEAAWLQIREALTYLAGQPALIAVLGLQLARTLLLMPYRMLLPAFVDENLYLGATGLGLMLSASSAGSLVASLILTGLGDTRHKGLLLLIGGVASGLGLVAMVSLRLIPLPFLWIGLVGAFSNVTMVMTNTLTQGRCDPQYRGRVSGVAMMLQGMQPLGSLPEGALADAVGVPWVLGGQGVLLALVFGGVARLRPELRRLR